MTLIDRLEAAETGSAKVRKLTPAKVRLLRYFQHLGWLDLVWLPRGYSRATLYRCIEGGLIEEVPDERPVHAVRHRATEAGIAALRSWEER